MSTAREDAREGGVGGKLRTRQTRRKQATPYDRPAAAARGHRGDAAERRGNRWISKVVDPASTFITKGATRLLSSVFGKRLGAPPVEESPGVSVEQREATSDVCDAVGLSEQNCSPEIENQGSKCKDDLRSHPDGDDISELELLLKRKTFTRAEYEHVMELLHSQTIDTQKEDENKKNEPSTSLRADDYKKQDENSLPQESRIGSYKFTGITSIPSPTLKIPEEDLASPAEVAKAYMGSRSSKVSPTFLCLRSQMLREAIASPSFIGFAPKSSPICSKSVVRFSGVPGTLEDGCMTPRSRGRSVISKTPRSSYKHQPTITLKDGEIMASGYPGPSTSSQAPSNIAISSGKQVLKRRSSVIESAIGPIRRIRQKSNLIASSEDVISQIPRKLLPTANASVPLHSRELEEKIFQQLDKLVPSPKGQSVEARTVSKDELPFMLSSDVLHEAASKCVAKTDALSLLHVEANGKSEISSNFHTVSLSPMKSKTENRLLKSLLETGIATEAKEVGKIDASITETRPVIGSLDSPPSATTFDLLQRNSAFKMQAPDDSIEQEDNSWQDISRLSAPGEEKLQMNDHKSIISETVVTKRALISSEFMSDPNIKLRKMVEKGILDATTIAEVSLPPSTECHTMSSLPAEVPGGSCEGNAVPLFTFGSKSNALVFSASMMSHSDPDGQETGASSSTNITAPVECTKLLVAEKVLVGTSSSFAPTTLPTSSNLQFVASASSSQSNGSLASNATTFNSTSAAIFPGSLSGAVVSTGPESVSSCSNGPYTLPAFSVLPSVQFGSGSSAVSTDCILPVVKSISTGSEPKLHKDSPFVYASSSAVSSIFSSTGSSIFGFSAAASFSTTTFGSSRPVFYSQPAHSGDGTPFGQKNAGHSGSVTPSFGLACSSSGFSSSTLGSSITSGKPFGLCSGFGPNSASSPSLDASFSGTLFASTMKSPSVFGSSSQSTAASIFNSGFGSSYSSSSVSIFGIPSSSSATPSFSSSPKSPFSVSSSAATTPSVFSLPQATTTSASASSFTFSATMPSPPVSSAVPGSPENVQMNAEENNVDDVLLAPSSVLPMFGQSSNVPPSLPLRSTHTTSGSPVFQFTSSQPSALAQSQTPFQATGSFEFGGSFSMGSGGIDKSGRRFVKAKREKHRKK